MNDNQQTRIRRNQGWYAALWFNCLAFLVGCGNHYTPVDAGTAQAALSSTLEAWKEGKQPADLLEGSPSIEVQDIEWNNGAKLLEYEIVSDDGASGQGLIAWVKMKLTSSNGKTTETTAKYVVNTSPDVRVLRIMMK